MKKLCFVNDAGDLEIVIPGSKEKSESQVGPMTDEQYEAHVLKKSVPEGRPYRFLEDEDIPSTREFRNAWEDTQPGNQVDISLEKARDIKLAELRREREELFKKNDRDFIIAQQQGQPTDAIKVRAQQLRDATNPLKALDVKGKYNDQALLNQIKAQKVE